jgi:hypothetical protein
MTEPIRASSVAENARASRRAVGQRGQGDRPTNRIIGHLKSDSVDTVVVAGRRLQPSPVFDTYWRFAAARQQVYQARLRGQAPPWTADPILASYRFTNCYRATDRVSQYLIKELVYRGDQDPIELLFRIVLFRFFNRISTWQLLISTLGELRWATFCIDRYDRVLTSAVSRGERIYSAAYVIPSPRLGALRKHTNHLLLLQQMLRSRLHTKIQTSESMADAFQVLRSYPGLGDFLAYQLIIDINYSTLINFDEMDFVVPGPGAKDGICKCFGPESRGLEAEIIRYMSDAQEVHLARLGLNFPGLKGRRLQLIDCQNLFCEVDKYARLVHPEIASYSRRARIKQRYVPTDQAVTSWFPPKWGINGGAAHSV